MNVLSVDLGTSNTVAVLSAHGRPPRVVDVDGASMMPSAVFATEDGTLVAGREAERRARLDPARFEPNPKRRIDEGTLLLGDKVIPVTDALAAVLGKVGAETSRQLDGAKPDQVRLTHPAQWGPVRRNVLLSAARQAGLGHNLVLVPEPVAAAAHFASFPGRTLAPGQALAVYDLGAGTFDVAIVGATQSGFTVLAESGLPDLGGLDVDQALLEHVGAQAAPRDPAGWQRLLRPVSTMDRRAARSLREDVRAAKEALSGHPQTDLPLPEPFEDVLVTRLELETLIRPNLMRSVELLASTIRTAGLSPDRLAGIYLVGGSSRIPLVAKLISDHLRVVPTSLDQPETAVALGAQHMSAEGVRAHTQDLATSLAQARTEAEVDERTISVASPRPTPAGQPPRPPAPPPVAAPPPQPAYPQPAYLPPPHPVPVGAPQPRNTKPWLIGLVIVAVLALASGAAVIIAANSGSDDGGQGFGPTTSNSSGPKDVIARPKKVPDTVDCASLVPTEEVGRVLGGSASLEASGGPSCIFLVKSTANDHRRFITDVSFVGTPYTRDHKTEFQGNDAFQDRKHSLCYLWIAIAADRSGNTVWLSTTADGSLGDPCTGARNMAEIAFANLPDA